MTDYHQEDPLVPPRDLVSKHCIGERDFREIGEIMVRGYIGRGYVQPDSRVLDVGCGLGRLARPLTTFLSERGEYQGLDIHQGSIEWCQSRYSQIPNFHFKWADLYSGEYNPQGKFKASEYRFPYDADQFDFVILSSVFTHMLLDGVANYLAEISRVLKFGGRCAITYFLLTPKLLDSFGKSWFRIDGGLVPNNEIPEIMTALQEDVVRSIYDANGLEIEHIYYGEWCGRPLVGAGFQDQILAKKVDRDWEPRVVVDVEAKEEQ